MINRITALVLFIGLAWGQQTSKDTSNACTQAEIDAKNDVNQSLWVKAGFSSANLANKLANSLVPNPRIENILGRSDDYIIEYNDCYKKEAQKLQNSYARIGCYGHVLIGTALIILSVSSDSKSVSSDSKKESSNNK